MELSKDDKKKHIAWSFWLLMVGLMWMPWPNALAAVFLIGLAKEIWDARYGSGFCLYDMAGNCVGMLGALLIGLPLNWAMTL